MDALQEQMGGFVDFARYGIRQILLRHIIRHIAFRRKIDIHEIRSVVQAPCRYDRFQRTLRNAFRCIAPCGPRLPLEQVVAGRIGLAQIASCHPSAEIAPTYRNAVGLNIQRDDRLGANGKRNACFVRIGILHKRRFRNRRQCGPARQRKRRNRNRENLSRLVHGKILSRITL